MSGRAQIMRSTVPVIFVCCEMASDLSFPVGAFFPFMFGLQSRQRRTAHTNCFSVHPVQAACLQPTTEANHLTDEGA